MEYDITYCYFKNIKSNIKCNINFHPKILLAISVANISAQFAPSRPQLNVPGAVPLGAVRQRGERIASGPAQGLIRVRRPLQKQVVHQEPQTSQARFFEEHEDKPVNEDLEDEPFIPHIQQSSPPSPPQPPKSLFTSEPQDNLNDIGFSQQTRFGNQPIAAPQQQTPSNAQRFNIERPKPAVAAPQLRQLQQRPVSRPAPSFDDYDERPSRPATRINNEQQRPQQKPRDRESKPKRPVATIISKYRDVSWVVKDYRNFILLLF